MHQIGSIKQRRIDYRKWSTTFAIMTCFLYSSLFFLLLFFLFPRCLCSDPYAHITTIPVYYTVAYVLAVLYNLGGVIATVLVVLQLSKRQCKYFKVYIAITISTEVLLFFVAIFAAYFSSFDVSEYEAMLYEFTTSFLVKDEVQPHMTNFLSAIQGFFSVLKTDLDIDNETFGMRETFEVFLKPEVVVISEAALNVLKIWVVFQLFLVNCIFVATCVFLYLYYRAITESEKFKTAHRVQEISINENLLNNERPSLKEGGSCEADKKTIRISLTSSTYLNESLL